MIAPRHLSAFLLATVVVAPAVRQDSKPSLALDHVPIAVSDLEAAETFFRDALGFSIKPGRAHENTIDNRHIKFGDGSALELITAAQPVDELAQWYLNFLEHGNGAAFLSLTGGAITDVATALAAAGYDYRLTAGESVSTLAAAPGDSLYNLFFVEIHDRAPDSPEHLDHANHATRLRAVWWAAGGRRTLSQLMEHFAVQACGTLELPFPPSTVELFQLERGEIYLVDREAYHARSPVLGVTVEVPSLTETAAALSPTVRSAALVAQSTRGRSLILPPSAAHGIFLEFLEPTPVEQRRDPVCGDS
jgi:catechol 2,3-dioxygenase-like lactoylglutathione lyase family enzyme